MEVFQLAEILTLILCALTKPEDDLQYLLNYLNSILEEFSMEISTEKNENYGF
jgi:hypothetical protein